MPTKESWLITPPAAPQTPTYPLLYRLFTRASPHRHPTTVLPHQHHLQPAPTLSRHQQSFQASVDEKTPRCPHSFPIPYVTVMIPSPPPLRRLGRFFGCRLLKSHLATCLFIYQINRNTLKPLHTVLKLRCAVGVPTNLFFLLVFLFIFFFCTSFPKLHTDEPTYIQNFSLLFSAILSSILSLVIFFFFLVAFSFSLSSYCRHPRPSFRPFTRLE